MEIDKKNSTFECIKFKPCKVICYDDVAKALFFNKKFFYIDYDGGVCGTPPLGPGYADPNNGTSEKQLKKLLAINKLMNVAKYLNGNWKPDWNDGEEVKYYIEINNYDTLKINGVVFANGEIVYFKNEDTARKAIKILGEDTIRLALSTDW